MAWRRRMQGGRPRTRYKLSPKQRNRAMALGAALGISIGLGILAANEKARAAVGRFLLKLQGQEVPK